MLKLQHMASPSPLSLPSSSDDGRVFGCIPRILRRILCFGVLPSFGDGEEKDDATSSRSVAPGIVARLMGLESVPVVDDESGKTESRSMKMNGFLDYQQLEDDDFFILSFERRPNSYTRCRRFCRFTARDSCLELSRERGKETPKFDLGESENSSPNSVLEFDKYASEDRNSTENSSVSDDSELRRTLSEDLENCGWGKRRRKNRERDEIGEEAGKEVAKSKWIEDEISRENAAEIGGALTMALLDLLLHELFISLLLE